MKIKNIKGIDILTIIIILLAGIVSFTGVVSFHTGKSFYTVNQYGDTVKMFGSGIYAHDSYFKAPIFIGTDFAVLVFLIPMLIIFLIMEMKKRTNKTKINLLSAFSALLYYILSLAIGAAYNRLHLIYIALFSCTLFAVFWMIRSIDIGQLQKQQWKLPTKGIIVFLYLCGVALTAAWLPDIISSLAAGTSLAKIEVYTTEITYVIDMGIIGPLCFICVHLMRKKDGLGTLLLAILLKLCLVVGVMIIPQTVYQILSGSDMELMVIITKLASFVILGAFAVYFDYKYYKLMSI